MSATAGNHVVDTSSDMAKKEDNALHFSAKTLGDLLRERREKVGLTPSELAVKINLTRSSIYAYESGQAWPSFPKLVELARVLRIRPDELPGLDDWDELDRNFPAAAAFDVKTDKAKPWAFAIQLGYAALSLSESQRRAVAELLLPVLREQVGEKRVSHMLAKSDAIGQLIAEILQRHPELAGDDVSADAVKSVFGEFVDAVDGSEPEVADDS